MPIPLYKLDDRRFEDIKEEMIARIPAHTPEWTNPVEGDPGRTMIDLFAWLADTILYRVNLIPQRQRLAFLRLLNIPMRPAEAAQGLVTLEIAPPDHLQPVAPPVHTPLQGPVNFETTGEIGVLPVQGHFFIKRKPAENELKALQNVIQGLESVYGLDTSVPYITTPVFAGGQPDSKGLDIAAASIDGALWIALAATKVEYLEEARQVLGYGPRGARLINIGVAPRIAMPDPFEQVGPRAGQDKYWAWELVSSRRTPGGEPDFIGLEVVSDGTCGFTTTGVVRLRLPDASDMGTTENDVTKDPLAGVGRRPPRIDDEKLAGRLVTWICLRPNHRTHSLPLSWAGVNAVTIDQRQTSANLIVATADGRGGFAVDLPGENVDPTNFKLQVEEPGRGYQTWTRVAETATAGRDAAVYQLDAEAGRVLFGDGVRGRIPEAGMRIRIDTMRFGGGQAGNLAPGHIKSIAFPNLKVHQPLATSGGRAAETLDEAQARIPQYLKHRDRAVTAADYRHLALETPAVTLGRVEVLPRFQPHKYRQEAPGVVSVMVLPAKADLIPPNPRPDRITLERVHAFLDQRRPLATEMYIIGVNYVPLGLTAAVAMEEGFGHDEVIKAVRARLADHLWPLYPGGDAKRGWPLGREVVNLELTVTAARVEGVDMVTALNLFTLKNNKWSKVPADGKGVQRLKLEPWQLPELLRVVVADDEKDLPDDPSAGTWPGVSTGSGAPIPVVPEVC